MDFSDQTRILQPTPEGITEAASLLARGELVGLPTETVYGLAGDALNVDALTKIFRAKGRPTDDPLILHLAIPTEGIAKGWPEGTTARLIAQGVVAEDGLSAACRRTVDALTRTFWPGPLTLVLPRGPQVPTLATSGLDTVALRAPAHPVAQAVLRAVGEPLAAPSANRFGRISPTTAAHVVEELGGRIPAILDGGPATVGVESTVVRVASDGSLVCLRPGGLPMEVLEGALAGLSPSRLTEHPLPDRIEPSSGPMPSPGMLASHYAPTCPVVLLPDALSRLNAAALQSSLGAGALACPPGLGVGLLLQGGLGWEDQRERVRQALARFPSPAPLVACAVLAPDGALDTAARSLFGSLRSLDKDPLVHWIVAEPPARQDGLGAAIRDRLRRAAAPRPRSHEGSKPE